MPIKANHTILPLQKLFSTTVEAAKSEEAMKAPLATPMRAITSPQVLIVDSCLAVGDRFGIRTSAAMNIELATTVEIMARPNANMTTAFDATPILAAMESSMYTIQVKTGMQMSTRKHASGPKRLLSGGNTLIS